MNRLPEWDGVCNPVKMRESGTRARRGARFPGNGCSPLPNGTGVLSFEEVTLPLLAVLLLLSLRASFDDYLERLNSEHVRAHRGHLPAVFRGIFDRATYARANDYTLARSRLHRLETLVESALLAAALVFGLFPLVYEWLSSWLGYGVWGQAVVLLALLLLLSLPGLPFSWYGRFRLEEAYGFNRSSLGLWWSDKLKGLVLAFLLGVPLLALILSIVVTFPESWWIFAFAAVFGVQILLLILYPILIVPLFNRLRPLEQGELKDRLMALADRTGFHAKTIQVMDGSKRSGHSNAFFTGFGRFRRIVLFDTLLDQLRPEEIEAVLAHEIGHYRCGHIPKRIALSAISLGFTFFFLQWLSAQAWFTAGFGFLVDPVEQGSLARIVPAFFLFLVLSPLVSFWMEPLSHALSRRHEYQADRFAREALGSPGPLVSALRTLYRENLGNLVPHPLYSRFHYSHPTLREREQSLRGEGGEEVAAAGS